MSSALSSPTELLAIFSVIVAGVLQISSSFVKTMVPLRWLAVLSNLGFLVYGVLHPLVRDGADARRPAADQRRPADAR